MENTQETNRNGQNSLRRILYVACGCAAALLLASCKVQEPIQPQSTVYPTYPPQPTAAIQVTPTSQFKLESICFPPMNPSTMFDKIVLPEKFTSTNAQINEHTTVEVRDYTDGKVITNPAMLTRVYELFKRVQIPEDLTKFGGNFSAYKPSPIVDGTTMIIHDSAPSQYLGCIPGALAMTSNAPKSDDNPLPDVSEVSLQRVRAFDNGTADSSTLAWVLITEVCQQHMYPQADVTFNESLCNGFGFMIAFLQANILNTQTSEALYEEYVTQAQTLSIFSQFDSSTIPFAVFSQETFTTAFQEITEPVVLWNE